MKITLTPEESARWDEGGFAGWRTEEDILERLDREQITEPVVVVLATGEAAFWVTRKGVRI